MPDKKQKIIYLINSFSSGGAERGILSLINNGLFDDLELELIAIHKGTGPLFDELKAAKFDGSIHYCSDSDKLTVVSMVKAFLYLFVRLIKSRPEFLMLSLTQSNLIGRTVAIVFPKLTAITFLHSAGISKKIYKTLLYVLSWRVDACLYDTAQTEKSMHRFFIKGKKRKWHFAPLVSIKNQYLKTDYTLHNPIEIFSAGRLHKVKNYEEAIKAIAILKQHGHKIRYNIAGIGDEENNLKSLARKLSLEKEINFMGFVSNWQEKLNDMDAFLMASIYEGLSIVTIEAMASAMPVVATDVGGITEYGKDAENMIKAKSTNAEDIAAAIEMLIKNKAFRKQISRSAAEDANQLFGEEAVREQLDIIKADVFS